MLVTCMFFILCNLAHKMIVKSYILRRKWVHTGELSFPLLVVPRTDWILQLPFKSLTVKGGELSRISCKNWKCYYDQKSLPFFFQILKAWLLNTWLAKFWALILSKGCLLWVYKFWISRSAITHILNWPIGPQRVGSREKWRHLLTSFKFQRVNTAYYILVCKIRV